jgi:hypothetical protein
MEYYWLFPSDQRLNTWIVHSISPDGTAVLRERYRKIACPKCKKLDRLTAVRLGIEKDVRVAGRGDFIESVDGFICCSRRLQKCLDSEGIGGLSFHHLPGDDDFVIAIPERRLGVVRRGSELRFGRPCTMCKRPKEISGIAYLGAVALPDETQADFDRFIYALDIQRENDILVTKTVRDVIKKRNLLGLEFVKAGET